jgi:hypothetical protein
MSKDAIKVGPASDDVKQEAGYFYDLLRDFVQPLLDRLDQQVDRRLVNTFWGLLGCLIRFRHNSLGLLLSELGGKLLGEQHAPAGTKRISNLLRSKAWEHTLIETFLLEKAQQQARQLQDQQQTCVLLWDESVLEKPESLKAQGLCAVRSSKAKRLKRIKPGFFNPPGGRPVHVPGFEWMGLLLAGLKTHPLIAFFRWYTTRGEYAQDRFSLQSALLSQAVTAFGRHVWHVFDRGYAGKRWLGELLNQQVGFVLRWPKRYQLVDETARRRASWQIARGRATQVRGRVWDAHQQQWRPGAALALAVTHPDYPDEALWLVVSRLGKGREPWYLLTNQACDQVDVLWSVVLAYARRWQIEACWRFSKSELALQSPRLWFWATRLKLMMVALVYAFLLSLLVIDKQAARLALLRSWCHRTGKRCQSALTPLYRLRAALAALLTTYQIITQTSG